MFEIITFLCKKGGTLTGAAIDKVALEGFNETNGARSTSQGVPKILVALTDGQSGDSVVQPSIDVRLWKLPSMCVLQLLSRE